MKTAKNAPRPAPLLVNPKREGDTCFPEPPQAEVDRAIRFLLNQENPRDAHENIRDALRVLQHVTWKHKVDGKWQEVPQKDPMIEELETSWRGTQSLAINWKDGGEETTTVCRVCGLDTAAHRHCSSNGKLHAKVPPTFRYYRRYPHLPGCVKDHFTKNVNTLASIMKHHIDNFEVCVFCMMVMTEITSPKINQDANKAELVQAGALEILMDTVKAHPSLEIIAQDVSAVLRNLLTNIPGCTAFEKMGGGQLLIQCIDSYPMNQELVHRASGCILIIASRGADSRRVLFKQGVIKTLITVLQTKHGMEYMIRRLIITTLQKLVKNLDKTEFCQAMDAVKGFTVLNTLRNCTADDDHQAMEEVLELRSDLPRGTFVDPTVLVIDAKGMKHKERIIQILKANQHREYKEDPPTPTIRGLDPPDWPAAMAASPLFPSTPSFGQYDEDEYDEPNKVHSGSGRNSLTDHYQKARTPGGGAPMTRQSTLPDVALADDMLTFSNSGIATPGTAAHMTAGMRATASGIINTFKDTIETEAQKVAEATMQLLDSQFSKNGVFDRTPQFVKKLHDNLVYLTNEVTKILKPLPKLVDIEAPVYVFGDIHGNFADLQYFIKNLTVMDNIKYSPYSFLFVGDYVDRGRWGPEVMGYLFALKVLAPSEFILLRGNHEDNDVNGDVGLYGDGCFKTQCLQLFSPVVGSEAALRLFNGINSCFSHFPIAAIIENKIFATHGGIPRYNGGPDNRLETLRDPDFAAFTSFILPPRLDLSDKRTRQQVYAHDCIWSDPSGAGDHLNVFGFGTSQRGGQVISYGQQAIHSFLDATGLDFIIRGHEEKADGLNISKQARVLTVFSTSDYCGKGNQAGVALVRKQHNGDLLCRMIHRAKPLDQASAY